MDFDWTAFCLILALALIAFLPVRRLHGSGVAGLHLLLMLALAILFGFTL